MTLQKPLEGGSCINNIEDKRLPAFCIISQLKTEGLMIFGGYYAISICC